MDLWFIFITGLTVGSLNCLAVQGGLLASVLAAREEGGRILPVASFLISKLLAYSLLGFLLGLFGQTLSFSDTTSRIIQIAAGLYMIAIALDLLKVHPIFRYAVIQPPRALTRLIHNRSKGKDIFAPALLGALTVFIPCGTTLAIVVLAISTASPILGMMTMAVFILGTSPLFFALGYLTSSMSHTFRAKFLKIAALAVFILGITSINGALVAAGSPVTLQTLAELSPIQIDLSGDSKQDETFGEVVGGVQSFNINVGSYGYSPTYLKAKKDIPVKLNLISKGAYNCALAFRIPALGISKNLRPTGLEIVEFTPKKEGRLVYTCSMGMYSGVIEVI